MDFLIHVLIMLIVLGILVWVVNALLPIDATIKRIINAVLAVIVVIYLLTRLLPVLP